MIDRAGHGAETRSDGRTATRPAGGEFVEPRASDDGGPSGHGHSLRQSFGDRVSTRRALWNVASATASAAGIDHKPP